MKNATLITTQICSCPNQYLLTSGQVCELCMGTVSPYTEPISQPMASEGTRFDQQYFDALETLYEDIEFAA